jgi:uncharacterized membrane protein YuzA (DUF378 family)
MTKTRRSSALDVLAALLTGLAGFIAFNVVDGVFGLAEAILGLVACIVITIVVVRRATPGVEEPDA